MRYTHFERSFSRDAQGSIVVLFALLMVLIIGFIGLGVEVNAWYRQKSDLQKAADSAAIAAANALNSSACGQTISNSQQACLQTVIKASISANGFGPRAGGQTLYGGVGIQNPYLGRNDQVQVCVSLTESRLFSAISEGNGTITINTCAAAQLGSSNPYALALYSRSSSPLDSPNGFAFAINGTTVNLNDAASWEASEGSAAYFMAGTLKSAANFGAGSVSGCCVTPSLQSTHAVTDPYASIVPPPKPAPAPGVANGVTVPSTPNANGTYAGQGSFSLPGYFYGQGYVPPGYYMLLYPTGPITMRGTYFIDVINTYQPISGTNVTLFLPPSALQLQFGGTLNLSAPTSGPYQGLLAYAEPGGQVPLAFYVGYFTPGWSLTGTVYGASLDFRSGAASASGMCLQIAPGYFAATGGQVSMQAVNNANCSAHNIPAITTSGNAAKLIQ